jgi:hypothetical protein
VGLEHLHRLDVDVAVRDHSIEFTRFRLIARRSQNSPLRKDPNHLTPVLGSQR